MPSADRSRERVRCRTSRPRRTDAGRIASRPSSMPQRHRAHVLSPEGLPSHRHQIRSSRNQFPRSRLHRCGCQLLHKLDGAKLHAPMNYIETNGLILVSSTVPQRRRRTGRSMARPACRGLQPVADHRVEGFGRVHQLDGVFHRFTLKPATDLLLHCVCGHAGHRGKAVLGSGITDLLRRASRRR